MTSIQGESYGSLLREVKERIRSAQLAAQRSVNRELIELYWDIGRLIVQRQEGETWGRSIVENLSADLRAEFPGISGFSSPNLYRMRQFCAVYRQNEILSPLVREISWTKNLVIMDRCKDDPERELRSISMCQAWNTLSTSAPLRLPDSSMRRASRSWCK